MAHVAATPILDAFGGYTKLAGRLGVPVTTAHTWKRTGKIPGWRLDAIERAANEDGIALTVRRLRKPKRKAA